MSFFHSERYLGSEISFDLEMLEIVSCEGGGWLCGVGGVGERGVGERGRGEEGGAFLSHELT